MSDVIAPSRPALRYLGGKWRLAPWIIEHMPSHLVYVEPFGGAASVLLQKPRSEREVYNDLDGELVNLFSILRSDRRAELVRQVRLTPYALREFRQAFEPAVDPIERARRLLVRSHMGHGTRGTGLTGSMGFRRDGMKGQTNTAANWGDIDRELDAIGERFRGVLIEERPAIDVIAAHNDASALIYLDPPYLPSTRSGKRKLGEGYHTYVHEMSIQDHSELLTMVCRSNAQILISGYPADLYERALADWTVRTIPARSNCNAPRTETLWLNKAAAEGLAQLDLFQDVA